MDIEVLWLYDTLHHKEFIMAHYAELDGSNIVTRVIVVGNENCLDGDGNESEAVGIAWCENFFKGGTWIQTSFNTCAGKHFTPNSRLDSEAIDFMTEDGGTPLRKNYAGKGYIYDSTRDAFHEPQYFPSWILNETTCRWDAPVTSPDDGKSYVWDEDTTSWVEV